MQFQTAHGNALNGTHSGLQTPFGDIYLPMQEALSGFSQDMFDIAQRNCGKA